MEILSVGKIAKMCHVGRATVQRWINDGKIKAFTLPSGHFRVRCEDFLQFLRQYNMPVPEELNVSARKILIVDDDEDIVDLVRQVITGIPDLSVDIRSANSGVQACLQLGVFKPELLILDLRMPDVDGLEVARGIYHSPDLEGTQVLVITGYATDENMSTLKAMGIGSVLTKPFQFDELTRLVKESLKV